MSKNATLVTIKLMKKQRDYSNSIREDKDYTTVQISLKDLEKCLKINLIKEQVCNNYMLKEPSMTEGFHKSILPFSDAMIQLPKMKMTHPVLQRKKLTNILMT